MPLAPRPTDIPKIPRALKFYQVMSFITGSFLLLLVVEMIVRYGFGYYVELAGPYGFVWLVPHEEITAVNLSIVVVTIHGWLYVVYLISSYLLWTYMRWTFGRLFVLALGGIVPVLSFILEGINTRRVATFLAENSSAPGAADVSTPSKATA
jgi:integral membrane protein